MTRETKVGVGGHEISRIVSPAKFGLSPNQWEVPKGEVSLVFTLRNVTCFQNPLDRVTKGITESDSRTVPLEEKKGFFEPRSSLESQKRKQLRKRMSEKGVYKWTGRRS